MSAAGNTLLLRLAGPMQSWGTSSRLQLRRSDAYPSKSGVLGLILCAMGVRREISRDTLSWLTALRMGVRVDRPGSLDWDYHTAGAKTGIRSADRKIKKTATTGEHETLLSRRQYLYDASFMVALQGDPDMVGACAAVLQNPVWPVFLGRKSCIPAEPVCEGGGVFDDLNDALSSLPWRPRISRIDRDDWRRTRTLDTYIEHPPGSPPPADARLVHDVPRVFGFHSHAARWVVHGEVTVPVGEATQKSKPTPYRDPYGPEWDQQRKGRLEIDGSLCVFCKSPAVDVHHVDYADVRPETLRSLCKDCHDACTMLEYGNDMRSRRIDPSDPAQRQEILGQIERLMTERRLGRRRELLEAGRASAANFFDDAPGTSQVEDW